MTEATGTGLFAGLSMAPSQDDDDNNNITNEKPNNEGSKNADTAPVLKEKETPIDVAPPPPPPSSSALTTPPPSPGAPVTDKFLSKIGVAEPSPKRPPVEQRKTIQEEEGEETTPSTSSENQKPVISNTTNEDKVAKSAPTTTNAATSSKTVTSSPKRRTTTPAIAAVLDANDEAFHMVTDDEVSEAIKTAASKSKASMSNMATKTTSGNNTASSLGSSLKGAATVATTESQTTSTNKEEGDAEKEVSKDKSKPTLTTNDVKSSAVAEESSTVPSSSQTNVPTKDKEPKQAALPTETTRSDKQTNDEKKKISELPSDPVPPPPSTSAAQETSTPKASEQQPEEPQQQPTTQRTTAPAAKVARSTSRKRSTGGVGTIHPDTSIPNTDVALRLLRKFATKTRHVIPEMFGGTKKQSYYAYFFNPDKSKSNDPIFKSYSDLMKLIIIEDDDDDDEQNQHNEEAAAVDAQTDRVVDSILGQSGDSMIRARKAIASFSYLMSILCHASSHRNVDKDKEKEKDILFLLPLAIDTAQSLVVHGCLDYVQIGFGGNKKKKKKKKSCEDNGEDDDDDNDDILITDDTCEYHMLVHTLCESIFVADLSDEKIELSSLKFLLSTGCRSCGTNDAILHGTHLLQTIRVMYHVYLTTLCESNKTTARASLQQLVTSVFTRMQRECTLYNSNSNTRTTAATTTTNVPLSPKKTSSTIHTPPTSPLPASSGTTAGGGHDPHSDLHLFPTDNHRDGFLVMRSLCKLSMRSLQTQQSGLQVNASSVMWDGAMQQQQQQQNQQKPSPSKTNKKTTEETTGTDHPTQNGSTTTDPAHQSPSPAPLVKKSSSSAVQPSSSSAASNISYYEHPALESKIFALELLLYVLDNTDMSETFLNNSGQQFHYAIRNYLCVSLLKNCTSTNTTVVNLSLRLFVPLVTSFRFHLKTEIEAFVTNVFFVILDSKNSPVEHKSLVVTLFEEICSDSTTLAEIFLNYDCDLSAVDLFHRIVDTLSRVAKGDFKNENDGASSLFTSSTAAARKEKIRHDGRELRLDAMRALRQVLASLHESIVVPAPTSKAAEAIQEAAAHVSGHDDANSVNGPPQTPILENGDAQPTPKKESLVQIYDSKKRRRQEESDVILKFNKKPTAGIKYASDCGHIDGDDPGDIATFLLKNKDTLDKTQIGEYLGREPEYQNGLSLKVLHAYVNMLDFSNMMFAEGIRYYLSGFRLPGEAQKIDRIMEKFAERYTYQNPTVFPTADAAFILAFSIIMLNTDLHNPAIKEERRMTKEGFIRNNRGICDGQDLPEEFLTSIFDRIKNDPISLKEDDEMRDRVQGPKGGEKSRGPVLFGSHYDELDKTREHNFQKERDQIVRTTESLLRRKRHGSKDYAGGKHQQRHPKSPRSDRKTIKFVRTEDAGLRDEYVSPMFEVAWAPALAAFSTAMESANGTIKVLSAFASDEEMELAVENAAETIEVCLTGFRYAICTASLCGNETARDAFMGALASFSHLGSGELLEPRHVRCVQTLLKLGRDDGELLGSTWEHVFKALSEVDRYHQIFHLMARNDRAAAAAATRRQRLLEKKEKRLEERSARRRAVAESDDETYNSSEDIGSIISDSEISLEEFDDISGEEDEQLDDDEMDKRAIDQTNARIMYDAVSESLIDSVYIRSSALSEDMIKVFVLQLCRVSRIEISGYGGHVGSNSNAIDLTKVHYFKQHTLLNSAAGNDSNEKMLQKQPNIYSLQKLVEVTHYSMDNRSRLVFADIWALVAGHLTSTALHANEAVAIYAIDSFRQLSTQYLQREELGGFEFQRRFLKPFETIMSRCEHESVKELLLKCVDRIIFMFGSDTISDGKVQNPATLRSGWRPVLAVLGIAGRDPDDRIANLGFEILTSQLRSCLADTQIHSALLEEHFIDLVDALFVFITAQRESMSILSIDHLVALSNLLAKENVASSGRSPGQGAAKVDAGKEGDSNKPRTPSTSQQLELWWPILLGLSRSVGDTRKIVRTKSLTALLEIVNSHFFPDSPGEDQKENDDLQTLQLIFRGVFVPVLEHAEAVINDPSLPEDFERFVTKEIALESEDNIDSWQDTMFEHLIDGSVALCVRSVKVFSSNALMVEILAMLNSCLTSDNSALAVRGLQRLYQFIVEDLSKESIADETWATVCHMLSRCLALENVPAESVLEEQLLAEKRYIASNAILVIGLLLTDGIYSDTMGLQWCLFLTTELGNNIKAWEKAAAEEKTQSSSKKKSPPPHYFENALYGRTWMNRILLRFASNRNAASVDDVNNAMKDQIQSLSDSFLLRYEEKKNSEICKRWSTVVCELLDGYASLNDEDFVHNDWLVSSVKPFVQSSKDPSIQSAANHIVERWNGSTKSKE